jgi:hypothetical protein
MARTRAPFGLLVALLLWSTSASAQVVHSLGFGLGGFLPRGLDSRVAGDVWVANLSQPEVLPGVTASLDFDIKRFRGPAPFGEWNIGFGDHIEVGAGLAYYRRSVDSHYLDLINGARPQSPEIGQTLSLRMVPISGVVRFLPFGNAGGVQPYVGAGVAAVLYRYAEVGEFVDTTDFSIFRDRFIASGTGVGPVLVGGLRLPIRGDIYAFTVEGRFQFVSADTGGSQAGFLSDTIDLSGGKVNFGFLVRF